MSRFYVGQPVVCVRHSEDWVDMNLIYGTLIPSVGSRYVVSGEQRHPEKPSIIGISLRESDLKTFYAEEYFAPVTEETVRGLLAVPVDAPRELVDA